METSRQNTNGASKNTRWLQTGHWRRGDIVSHVLQVIPTQTAAFHSGCHVHGVSKQTVSGHGGSHHTCHHRTCRGKNRGQNQSACPRAGPHHALAPTTHIARSAKAMHWHLLSAFVGQCLATDPRVYTEANKNPHASAGNNVTNCCGRKTHTCPTITC